MSSGLIVKVVTVVSHRMAAHLAEVLERFAEKGKLVRILKVLQVHSDTIKVNLLKQAM